MPATRVYVGNISDDVRERDVEKFFKGYDIDFLAKPLITRIYI